MPNIGTRASAAYIHDAVNNSTKPGADWKELKNGSVRSVWLNVKEDVVYKVDTWMGDDDEYSNKRELHNARVVAGMARKGQVGPLVVIPKTSGYRINGDLVVAMEKAPGRHMRPPQDAAQQLFALHFEDMHKWNFKVKDGKVWPIDMGSPRVKGYGDRRVLHGGV